MGQSAERVFESWWAAAREQAADHTPPSDAVLDRLLDQGAASALDAADTNALFNLFYREDFKEAAARVLERAREVRFATFGRRTAVMAPVEVSNRCVSDCRFCGWRASNPDVPRLSVSRDLFLEQVDYLLGLGIDYIEIVGGDDFGFVRRDMVSLVQGVRDLMRARSMDGQICICSMAVTEAHYREWRDAGVDAMFVWQETYDPELYRQQIAGGPKAHGIDDDWRVGREGGGYAFRLGSQERALRAGLDVGLGFMLGLNPNINAELLMLHQHVHALLQLDTGHTRHPLIIGMPTWNRITTPRTDMRPNDTLNVEDIFAFVSAVVLLALPKGAVWVFPNCRVSLPAQVHTIETSGVFTSTEVKLGPGGYLPALLRERQVRGQDSDGLQRRIAAELGVGCEDLEAFEAGLDDGEQFCHHFHPHGAYVRAMRERGLHIVPFEQLLACGPQGGVSADSIGA